MAVMVFIIMIILVSIAIIGGNIPNYSVHGAKSIMIMEIREPSRVPDCLTLNRVDCLLDESSHSICSTQATQTCRYKRPKQNALNSS